MERIPFDPKSPNIEAVRQIVFARLTRDKSWNELEAGQDKLDPYVAWLGHPSRGVLDLCVREVFWNLVSIGILTPGTNESNLDLPWFRITEYGRRVIEDGEALPYDPTGYMESVRRRVNPADATVLAYLLLRRLARDEFAAHLLSQS
ncbi:MAG: hypothetical protein HYY93_04145 [Planctomycetes bacterium]|nr:hypothetical protein [Planctomycetota bacterium]